MIKILWIIPALIAIISFQNNAVAQTISGGYQIEPEDVLEIGVWKEEGLQRDVLVRPDGRISFPLIGDIEVQGYSPEYVRAVISEKLIKFIPDPVVTVLVKKVAGYKVYVLGQVKNAGQFNVGRYIDVLQALAMAGGPNAYAAEEDIMVIRRGQTGMVTMPFNLGMVKSGKKLSQNIMLKSGDVVVVP